MSLFREIYDDTSTISDLALLENIQELEEYVDTRGMTLGELEKKFGAALRGLQIADKMKNPINRKKHLSRVITNISLLWRALKNIHDAIEVEDKTA